jgi:clan AA aspartic protease
MIGNRGILLSVLSIANPRRSDVAPIQVRALVDTACVYRVIPERIRAQLHLEESDQRPVMLADGSWRSVPHVGPIEVRFKNRCGYGGALVMGDQVIPGAIAMEDMDLVVTPRERLLDVNPANSDFPACRV